MEHILDQTQKVNYLSKQTKRLGKVTGVVGGTFIVLAMFQVMALFHIKSNIHDFAMSELGLSNETLQQPPPTHHGPIVGSSKSA